MTRRSAESIYRTALALLAFALATTAVAGPPVECQEFPRSQDSLWVISTRHICESDLVKGAPPTQSLDVSRLEGDEWKESSVDAYLASDEDIARTVFFLHGYRTSHCEAVVEAQQVFQTILADHHDARPLRLVCWSWPSERYRGNKLRADAQAKAWRSDFEGYVIAALINQSRRAKPVSLIGYSYGTRMASVALHLLDGGTVDHYSIAPTEISKKIRIRVVMLAAAMHNYWLDQGQRLDRALHRVEMLTLLTNCCDRVLRLYPRAMVCRGRGGPEALGATGLVAGDLAPDVRDRYTQEDVCNYIGKNHPLANYLCSAYVVQRIREGVFGD